ncbi:MAG: hypothetical protein HOB73_09265 [Planctomycetaceae bacterium]|nr:hypothetical protein [Planctomycetaceae bacterium]
MNLNSTFKRKVAYITGIVLLLFPLFFLGQPATSGRNGSGEVGGKLAQLRAESELAQSNLGEINPVSSSMQLATFGLRPVAVIVLWEKATKFQKMEDYDNVTATINQISKLQPNFISIWKFQAHNLAYNISVDFDNYRHRYQWVRRGIQFLMEGTRYNSRNAKLVQEVAFYTGSKIGYSDEKVQFRSLFSEDEMFHGQMSDEGIDLASNRALGANGKPDNWKASYLWYEESENVASLNEHHVHRDPIRFFEKKPQALVYYAMALEDDGYLDAEAQQAFAAAHAALIKLGNRDLSTQFGFNVRLNQYGDFQQDLKDLREKMDALAPELRQELIAARFAGLSKPQQDAYNMEVGLRSEYHRQLANEASQALIIPEIQIAEAMPLAIRNQARSIAMAAEDVAMKVDGISYLREMINYDYWLKRCEMEQMTLAITARKTVKQADDFFVKARLEEARKLYEVAWVDWRKIFDRYPSMITRDTGKNLESSISNYIELLQQFDEELPEDFVLRNLVATLEFAPKNLPTPNIQFPSPSQPNRIRGSVPNTDYLDK